MNRRKFWREIKVQRVWESIVNVVKVVLELQVWLGVRSNQRQSHISSVNTRSNL